MAKVKNPPPFIEELRIALIRDLKKAGIKAQIHEEPVPTTKLYRVTILAPQFKAMRHSERQNLVWRIAEKALSPDDQLRISMILTLSNEEANRN